MESPLQKHRNVLTLALLLFVQMLGLAVQVKRTNEQGTSSNLLHLWAVQLVSPIEKAVVHTQQSMRGGWHDYFYLRNVRRENAELKQQIEEMRLRNVRLQEDANQARRIQSLLAFKEQFISKTVAAQVIGTSGTELSRLLYIDRGSDDGIKPDMAVITPDGIVGKVLRVLPSTSQVLEINDQTSGVGAILVKSRLQGIVKGTPAGDVILNNIMADENIKPGDEITTSGGDRIFPKGLPVGRVSSVFPGHDVFLNIRLAPAADLNRLEEVLVVTEVQNLAPDTKDLGPIRAADILAARLPSVPQPKPEDQAAQKPTDAATTPKTGTSTAGSTKPKTANPIDTSTNPNTKPAAPKTTTGDQKPAAKPAAPKTQTPATTSLENPQEH